MLKKIKSKLYWLITVLILVFVIFNQLLDAFFESILFPVFWAVFLYAVFPFTIIYGAYLFENKKKINSNGQVVYSSWFGIHLLGTTTKLIIRIVIYGSILTYFYDLWIG